MASIYRDNARDGWRVQVYVSGVRRKLWLGDISKSAAQSIASHLDALAAAKETATSIPDKTEQWTLAVGKRIKQNLVAWGLVEQSSLLQYPSSLRAFCDAYFADRMELSQNSRERFKPVADKLCEQLGEKVTIRTISPGDADRFARWCRSSFAESHAGKTIRDAKQILQVAVRQKLIASNPFDGISTAGEHDETREHYVERSTMSAILAVEPNPDLRLLYVLARYGGLRVPSEPLSLRWEHVDFTEGVIRIPADTKTGSRQLPLFPEIRTELDQMERKQSGNLIEFNRSSAATNWREKLLYAIKRAGLEPWPKLWVNIRASCRTDLDDNFPSKVVDKWMGHSSAIAKKHYSRTTDAHWQKAICGVTGGVAETKTEPNRLNAEAQNVLETQGKRKKRE